MENAKGKKNSTKKSGGAKKSCKFQAVGAKEKNQAAGETSTQETSGKGTKRKRSTKDDKAACPQKMEPGKKRIRIHKKIPIPPLPVKLPSVNLLHRDIVRSWCRQLRLSTSGSKLEAYKRLCAYAYHDQKDFPATTEEAKMLTESQRKRKMKKGEMPLESLGLPEVIAPLGEGVPALDGATALLEGMDKVFATPATPEAVFASWSRIAAQAGQVEPAAGPREASDVRWCVVHGRSLPADTDGWVQLQFYAGQAWVPEKPGKVCALFLLPACTFPPPHLEDNMLCPKCVHRNKVLIKSLQ